MTRFPEVGYGSPYTRVKVSQVDVHDRRINWLDRGVNVQWSGLQRNCVALCPRVEPCGSFLIRLRHDGHEARWRLTLARQREL